MLLFYKYRRSTYTFAHLLCRVLEPKSAYFIEHPVVKEEVDSTAGSRFLSWHILDAKAVLRVYIITPKHIINYRCPPTCTRIQEVQFTLNVALYFRWWCENEKEVCFQMSSGFFIVLSERSVINLPLTYFFFFFFQIGDPPNRPCYGFSSCTMSFKHWLSEKMACSDLDQV